MSRDERTTTRRTFLKGAGVAAAAASTGAGPASAAPEGLSPVVGSATGVVRTSIPSGVIRYGSDRRPSFIVEFDEGEGSTLQSWADERSSRQIHSRDDERGWALLSAPMAEVSPPRYGWAASQPLEELGYVESIAFNSEISYPEPVGQLQRASDDASPAPWWARSLNRQWTKLGVAYRGDAPEADMRRVGELVATDQTTVDGGGATLAILDTGLDWFEAHYGDSVVAGKNLLTGATIDPSAGDYEAIADGNGHGSWCAGAARELADGADLLIGKTLADDGSGSTANIRAGLDWAAEKGADVISMSLGSALYNQALHDRIVELTNDQDILVVVAAGNSRYQQGVGPASPSDTPEALCVAATNAPEGGLEEMESAYFSQVGPDNGGSDLSEGQTRGARPDIAAPGMEISAPTASGPETLSGTSMATPIGAAVATLVRGAAPDVPAADVHDRLVATATRLPKAAETEVGGGCVHADRAVRADRVEQSQHEAQNDLADQRDGFNRSASGNLERLSLSFGGWSL
jgi:subtilisin family serine protease